MNRKASPLIFRFTAVWLVILFCRFASAKENVIQYSFDIYTQESGLPNNLIQNIFQDSRGWMWIGTSQGLSRFDGYEFRNFLTNPLDSTSLMGNLIRVIREDRHGNLLVGTENGGLNVFNRLTETFSHPLNKQSNLNFGEISVNDIEEDQKGNLWLGTDINILVIDTLGKITTINPKPANIAIPIVFNYIRVLQFDKKGNLWIGTNNGLFVYNQQTNEVKAYDFPFEPNQNREIWELYLDDEGLLWVGTYAAGLYIVNPATGNVRKIILNPEHDRTETVRTISKGVLGDFWIGTRGGLYTYSKTEGVTGFFKHDERNPRSLSNNSILSVYHDTRGETWIGTRGGLNLLAKSKQLFHNYGTMPDDNHYLNSNIVYAFWIDESGKIWIGTEDGGINIYNPSTGTYEYLMTNSNGNSLSENCIKAFLNDGKGNLWVATFLGGIDVIHLKTGKISHFKANPNSKGSLSDNRVWDLCMDNNRRIWVVTSQGVDLYNEQTNSFIHQPQLNGNNQVSWIESDSKGNLWMGSTIELIYFNQEENTIKRFNEYTRSMYEDSGNRIWIATMNHGIAIYDTEKGPLTYYDETDGLANNHALCVLEDELKNLWISTYNGLSRLNVETGVFNNFTTRDGLSNNQFCYGAAYKNSDGELFFGSVSGYNKFKPEDIVADDTDVPIVLTDLKIFNKSVAISGDRKSVLKNSISETRELVLGYDQNVFTIEFAALNYVNSTNNIYTYKLEGFNKDWVEPGKIRSATYTNLNPGEYTLKIKRIIPGMPGSGKELSLAIVVLPPYWKTKWFLILMLSLILAMIYALVRFFINREKIKNELVLERVNARKLHEIDMMKLKFFTNISHEIRTPLTLILGPLEKMLDKPDLDTQTKTNLELMRRNAGNLNKLVNQLLDFRKLQTGNLKLNLTEADIVEFIRNIVNSFNDFAIEKQVKLRFNTLKQHLFVSFDPDKIEKIMNNLLSNAFKFTDHGGLINVNISLIFGADDDDFSEADKEKQFIEISVKDSGRGIEPSHLDKIFHRFFQADNDENNAGFGIGLSLVKELVTLHKGKIFVTSKPGKGTRFTIRIPYQTSVHDVAAIPESQSEQRKPEEIRSFKNITEELAENINLRIMLVVDDNQDVRQFIAANFSESFHIIEARNGEEGWNLALKTIPDIVLSDIIMPETDGFELCKRLKNDERTSHIPVLLLTALHAKDHELKGITMGADDYITKPFDLSVLQAKVENMLSIRDSLRGKYAGIMVLEPTKVILASPDERFLQKAIEVIEQNIADSELDIESFSLKVGVSRMQLYRKLHVLTNMTVKEFIRHIRLKRAAQMLEQEKLNVSEVAYAVGFKDLSHFRKNFKQEFGMNATEFVNRNKGKSEG